MGPDTSKPALQAVGNYDLLEKIAEGGMGAVYRGRAPDDRPVVAIKIMPPHMAQNPVLLKRFEQEFRAASRLDHPNIVRALDYGETGTCRSWSWSSWTANRSARSSSARARCPRRTPSASSPR